MSFPSNREIPGTRSQNPYTTPTNQTRIPLGVPCDTSIYCDPCSENTNLRAQKAREEQLALLQEQNSKQPPPIANRVSKQAPSPAVYILFPTQVDRSGRVVTGQHSNANNPPPVPVAPDQTPFTVQNALTQTTVQTAFGTQTTIQNAPTITNSSGRVVTGQRNN